MRSLGSCGRAGGWHGAVGARHLRPLAWRGLLLPGSPPIGSPFPAAGQPPRAPPSATPQLRAGGCAPLVGLKALRTPAWTPAWSTTAGSPDPLGCPGLGPRTCRILQVQSPAHRGQLLQWSLLRTCCPPIGSSPSWARPCSPRVTAAPSPPRASQVGCGVDPPIPGAGSPPALTGGCCGVCTPPPPLALSWSEFASSGFQLQPPGWTMSSALQPPAPPVSGQTDGLGLSALRAGLPGAPGPHQFVISLQPQAWTCPCSTPRWSRGASV